MCHIFPRICGNLVKCYSSEISIGMHTAEDADSELAFVQAKAGAMSGYGLHQQFLADKP